MEDINELVALGSDLWTVIAVLSVAYTGYRVARKLFYNEVAGFTKNNDGDDVPLGKGWFK